LRLNGLKGHTFMGNFRLLNEAMSPLSGSPVQTTDEEKGKGATVILHKGGMERLRLQLVGPSPTRQGGPESLPEHLSISRSHSGSNCQEEKRD